MKAGASVAVDATCARIVKMELDAFQYVKLAGLKKIGNHELGNIQIQGSLSIGRLSREINFHPMFSHSSPWLKKELNDVREYLSLL